MTTTTVDAKDVKEIKKASNGRFFAVLKSSGQARFLTDDDAKRLKKALSSSSSSSSSSSKKSGGKKSGGKKSGKKKTSTKKSGEKKRTKRTKQLADYFR